MIKNQIEFVGLNIGLFPIVLAGILLTLGVLPEHWRTSWYFVPENYHSGQWWLPLSSQWVHLNIQHTIANSVGFLLLCILFLEQETTVKIAGCIASCLLSISLYLALFSSNYTYYAGFSGVLYGLFFQGSLTYWHRSKCIMFVLVTALAIKIAWDTVGPNAFEAVDWLGARVAVDVHLAGITGAGVFILIASLFNKPL